MKAKQILMAVLSILPIVSCNKNPDFGTDSSLPVPESINVDVENSTDTDLSICWDGTKAMNAGAVSFTVELQKNYHACDAQPIFKIVLVSDPVNDAALFTAMKKGDKYLVRVRANYPKAKYSDWVWLKDGEDIAVVKIGEGIVDEPISFVTAPSSRLNFASSKQLGINFSVSDFKDRNTDVTHKYLAALYRDEACTDLVLALDLPTSLWNTTLLVSPDYFPGFCFNALTPDTDYWCKVGRYEGDKVIYGEEVSRYHTLPDDTMRASSAAAGSAQPGDLLLCENFDDLCWGGNPVAVLASVSRKDRTTQNEMSFPTGDRTGDNALPTAEQDGDFHLVPFTTEMALWDNIQKPLKGSGFSFGDEWGLMIQKEGAAKNGMTPRSGSIKIGGSSVVSILVAPALQALSGPAKVKVKFRACNFNEYTKNAYDTDTKALYVFDDIKIADESRNLYDKYYETAKKSELDFRLINAEDGYGWKDYEFILEQVKPTSHIGIGGTRAVVASGQNRFYLDHISVELIEYQEEIIETIKPDLRLKTASSTSLGIEFSSKNFENMSDDYQYAYKLEVFKDASCNDLQLAIDLPIWLWATKHTLSPYFPGFKVGGLTPSTDYWCRVSCYDEETGNPVSDVKKFTTLADNRISAKDFTAASANEGDVILRETFEELSWYGDFVESLAGIGRKDRATATEFTFPSGDRTGENAIGTSEKDGDYNLVRFTTEQALWDNNLKNPVSSTDFGKEWGLLREQAKGTVINSMTCRAGTIKIGGSSACAVLVSPKLSMLKGTATVKLRFKACNYADATATKYDTDTKAAYVLNYLELDESFAPARVYKQYYETADKQEVIFVLNNGADDFGWKEYELTLENVTPQSQIGIGATRQVAATGQNRFFVDDIEVIVVKYNE